MPYLREFIYDVYAKHQMDCTKEIADKLVKDIEELANELHSRNNNDFDIVNISDADVEKFILDKNYSAEILEEEKNRQKEAKRLKEQQEQEVNRLKLEEERNRKAIKEHKPYQMGLF